MNAKETIRDFITTNFYVPEPSELPDDASLLDQGIIDSTGVLEIITYLESTFHITVEDDEMVPENLDSIMRITEYIAGKQTRLQKG